MRERKADSVESKESKHFIKSMKELRGLSWEQESSEAEITFSDQMQVNIVPVISVIAELITSGRIRHKSICFKFSNKPITEDMITSNMIGVIAAALDKSKAIRYLCISLRDYGIEVNYHKQGIFIGLIRHLFSEEPYDRIHLYTGRLIAAVIKPILISLRQIFIEKPMTRDEICLNAVRLMAAAITGDNALPLDIGLNDYVVSSEGAIVLAEAIINKNAPERLTLVLSSNDIGLPGVKAIADAIGSGRAKPGLSLHLGRNEINSEGFAFLASAIRSGKAPKGLSISIWEKNALKYEEVKFFADAIGSGDAPEDLEVSFSGCELDSSSMKMLLNTINTAINHDKCPKGLCINLSGNEIDIESATILAEIIMNERSPSGLSFKFVAGIAGSNICSESIQAIFDAINSGKAPRGLHIDLKQQHSVNSDHIKILANAIRDGKTPIGLCVHLGGCRVKPGEADMLMDAISKGRAKPGLLIVLDQNNDVIPGHFGIRSLDHISPEQHAQFKLLLQENDKVYENLSKAKADIQKFDANSYLHQLPLEIKEKVYTIVYRQSFQEKAKLIMASLFSPPKQKQAKASGPTLFSSSQAQIDHSVDSINKRNFTS